MSLHILHFANAFSRSVIYKNLIVSLDSLGIKQIAYSAVRTQKEAAYDPPELNHLDIHTNYILHSYDRLFFRNKIRKIRRNIFREVNLSPVNLIHAHTLYSDGATALKIKQKLDIPYIVAVRSTDLITFQKYRPDLRWRRNKILCEAGKIVFISPAHRSNFLSLLNSRMKTIVESKMVTVPNGIDSLFLDPPSLNEKQDTTPLKLLYVGRFTGRKNVPKLFQAVRRLSTKQKLVKLTVVGGGGKDETKIKQMIASGDYPFVDYLGYIKDKEKLRQIYRSHDIFIMASKRETFGLVYIEALSQGLPIMHAEGEGVDGYFDDQFVGAKIMDIYDKEEIAKKIEYLSQCLNQKLRKRCIAQAQRFDWKIIGKKYKKIYNEVI